MDIPQSPRPYTHRLPVQLRFTDIDMLGHVNNNVYFQLLDLGKSDYITRVLWSEFDVHGQSLAVVNVNCQFYAISLYDEPLEVLTRVDSVGTRSVTFEQRVVNSSNGDVKCICRSVMAGYDVATASSMTIPDSWRRLLEEAESLKKVKCP